MSENKYDPLLRVKVEPDQSYYAFKAIEENPIILDFTKHRYLGEIHKLLKEKFGLPEYYGSNWDALWDCLNGLFNGRGEWTVEIYGFANLPDEIREDCNIMLEIFDKVHERTPNIIFKKIT